MIRRAETEAATDFRRATANSRKSRADRIISRFSFALKHNYRVETTRLTAHIRPSLFVEWKFRCVQVRIAEVTRLLLPSSLSLSHPESPVTKTIRKLICVEEFLFTRPDIGADGLHSSCPGHGTKLSSDLNDAHGNSWNRFHSFFFAVWIEFHKTKTVFCLCLLLLFPLPDRKDRPVADDRPFFFSFLQ